MFSKKEKVFDPQVLSITLMGSVEETLVKNYDVSIDGDPVCVERDIIEYNGKWRTFGMEKFNAPCFVSAIHFYLSSKHLKNNDPVGTFILYLKEENIYKLTKVMGFDIKEDDSEAFLDCAGEIANIIAGQFKNELVGLNFRDLTMSHPQTQKNDISDGVLFDYNQKTYHELSFNFWKDKSLVICMSLSPLD